MILQLSSSFYSILRRPPSEMNKITNNEQILVIVFFIEFFMVDIVEIASQIVKIC